MPNRTNPLANLDLAPRGRTLVRLYAGTPAEYERDAFGCGSSRMAPESQAPARASYTELEALARRATKTELSDFLTGLGLLLHGAHTKAGLASRFRLVVQQRRFPNHYVTE